MSKKSKKRSRSKSPVRVSKTVAAHSAPAANRVVRAEPAQAAPVRTTADIAAEYHYVVSDLKRIGILAASMFALLVAVALVAQFVIQ